MSTNKMILSSSKLGRRAGFVEVIIQENEDIINKVKRSLEEAIKLANVGWDYRYYINLNIYPVSANLEIALNLGDERIIDAVLNIVEYPKIGAVEVAMDLGLYEMAKRIYDKIPATDTAKVQWERIAELNLRKTAIIVAPFTSSNIPHTNIAWIANSMLIETECLKTSNDKQFTQLNDQEHLFQNNNIIKNTLLPLKQIPDLQLALDVIALNTMSRSKEKVKITILNDETKTCSGRAGGCAAWKTISVKKYSDNNSNYKGVIIHEAWHTDMNIIYKNEARPWPFGNSIYEDAYKVAITKCLYNMYEYMGQPIPENASSYELGKNLYDITNSLWFIIKSIFTNTDFLLNQSNQLVYETILAVYSPYYHSSKEGVEFIVRYEQLIAEGVDKGSLAVLDPMKQYIDDYVKPDMREYVDNHPLNYLLKHHIDSNIVTIGNNTESSAMICPSLD